jgi:group II intron reverse transcriptase/maturase
MPYTEMDNITPSKLALISERARKEPKFQFTSLAHLLNEGFLKECYYRLGRDRASGIDGVTWKEYGENLDENLKVLVVRLKAKRYRPQPSRRTYVPKDEHSKRPLGLPALEDKIVQKGVARILEAIYEQDFLNCSYGFRPKRSCHQALDVVDKTILRGPIHYVVEADIKSFFDSVSHEWMVKCLEVRIKDPSLLLLITRFLRAGYIDAGEFVLTEKGTAQGGNLSPTLANIFLHYVLDLWFEKKIKPQVRGACHLVRYADDFLCLVQYAEDARYIEQAMRERFAKFSLELHPEKTRIVDFCRDARDKSSRSGHRVHTFDFLGFTHYWGKSRRGNRALCRKTSKKSFRRACRELSTWLREIRSTAKLKDWWPILQAKLRGHYQYYGISGNSRMIHCHDQIAKRLVFKWVNRRSQKVSFNWGGFNAYLKHYPLPKPRIVHKLYAPSSGS